MSSGKISKIGRFANMYAQVKKKKENRIRAVATNLIQKKSEEKQGFGFVNKRVDVMKHIGLQKGINSYLLPVAQLATYPISHTGETKESFDQILEEASIISRTAKGGIPLVKKADELSKLKPEVKKILHIVGHGNREQVGDFDDLTLHNHLESFRKYPTDFMTIHLHSCESGIVDDRYGKPTRGTSFAERLVNRHVFDNSHQADIKKVIGMVGNAVTDSNGVSRVLKDPNSESRYRELRDRARENKDEQQQIEEEYLKPLVDTYNTQVRDVWGGKYRE
jgi:hypothetical protein